MAKPLVIVESKAKAKTIEGFLGRDRYVVMASVGHVRDLPNGAKQAPKGVTDPKVRRLGIDVDDHFAPDLRRARCEEARGRRAQGGAEGRERALPRHRRGPRGRGDLLAPARGVEAEGPREAHGVPRDHRGCDLGGHRELARPRHEAGRGPGGPPGARPARGLRGLERRLPSHRPGHLRRPGPERRDAARRRPRARPDGVPVGVLLGPRRYVRCRLVVVGVGVAPPAGCFPATPRAARRAAARVGTRLRLVDRAAGGA